MRASSGSNRRAPGTALELAVEGAPVGGRRGARGGGGRGANAGVGRGDAPPPSPIPPQDAAQVAGNWPAGAVDARLSPYLLQAQQKWSVTPAANAGGYPGSPYFRISIADTERSLAATSEGELTVLPAFTGGPEQLWRIDQLADGTYRLIPKTVPGANAPMALSAIGGSSPTLEPVDASTGPPALAVEGAVTTTRFACAFVVCAGLTPDSPAQGVPVVPTIVRPATATRPAGANGFLQRWLILEPLAVPGQLTDSAVRATVSGNTSRASSPSCRATATRDRDGKTLSGTLSTRPSTT